MKHGGHDLGQSQPNPYPPSNLIGHVSTWPECECSWSPTGLGSEIEIEDSMDGGEWGAFLHDFMPPSQEYYNYTPGADEGMTMQFRLRVVDAVRDPLCDWVYSNIWIYEP